MSEGRMTTSRRPIYIDLSTYLRLRDLAEKHRITITKLAQMIVEQGLATHPIVNDPAPVKPARLTKHDEYLLALLGLEEPAEQTEQRREPDEVIRA